MKNHSTRQFNLLRTGLLGLAFFALQSFASNIDYTAGLSVWFDKPNTLDGRAIWLAASGDTMKNPDQDWEANSLPIGNGSMGANVMGSIAAERVTFNEKTLWRGGPNTAKGASYYWDVNKQSAHVLDEIRQAFAAGDPKRAERLTRDNFNGLAPYEADAEKPFRFGNFTTGGEFYVETGLSEVGMKDYKRILSLDSALAVVQFDKDGVAYQRQFFISYPDSIMVMRFLSDAPNRQNLAFSYCPNPELKGEMLPDGSDALKYTGVMDNNRMKYVIRVKAINKGGTVRAANGKLFVEGADEVMFLITADTDYKMNFSPDFSDPETYVGTDPEQNTADILQRAMQMSYGELFNRHAADYTAMFNRVKLRLNPNEEAKNVPTNVRLQRYRNGEPDYRLEELYYQFGRYLLIASSRPGNMPANLQGVWHNNIDGPWRVDYHNNINVQMNYWPACSTNLSECQLPLIDFIRGLEKPGEKTAQAYFGARGWTASISGNIFGFTSPLSSKDMSWNFNPMAGPWLATHIWEQYDYTRDRKFLKENYELLKGSARFAVDYLWRKPDGTYTAAPSTSPEHGPVDQGATFVHAVVREILANAIDAGKVLGVDAKERRYWEHVLKHLAPYQTGRYGQLMEWSVDIDDPEDNHRHVNHLFGLHPGHTISPITTPELAEAARVVLEHRGDFATGWSMGWKLNQWARLHDGNHAYVLYGNLLKNGTLNNLWDTHAPFQIDGNFGGVAGVTEMLLQSHMGFMHLLPALPDAWKDGEISGICAKGNFEVSLKWKDNRLVEAVVLSKSGETCNLRYQDKELAFKTKKGNAYKVTLQEGGRLSVLPVKSFPPLS